VNHRTFYLERDGKSREASGGNNLVGSLLLPPKLLRGPSRCLDRGWGEYSYELARHGIIDGRSALMVPLKGAPTSDGACYRASVRESGRQHPGWSTRQANAGPL